MDSIEIKTKAFCRKHGLMLITNNRQTCLPRFFVISRSKVSIIDIQPLDITPSKRVQKRRRDLSVIGKTPVLTAHNWSSVKHYLKLHLELNHES